MAKGHKRAAVKENVMNSIPIRVSYLIFLFFRSDNKAMRGVEFCQRHTYNASRIWRKVENGSVIMETECLNIRYPCSLLQTEQEAKNNINL